MAGIPNNIIDQVRDRTDIVEIIGRYIPLKRAGRNFKAPCPFHHEKTPSFMVSPAKQIFHCFGCGAGGNVFNFLMKYERLEFPEAVRSLAERSGIDIPAPTRANSESVSLAQRLAQINELAAKFYQNNLLKTEPGASSRQYLEKRGITRDMIEKFRLGYAPGLWDGFVSFAKKHGLADSFLEKAGLALRKKDGSFYDRFRHRIIFPILDIKGKVRGFGGRILDEGQPKYMNSPETPIYNKGRHLYGLNLSWEEIRSKDQAVIVEGYTDLMTPYQNGVKNIVASLGTALTVDQIKLVKRFTNNIVVLFDADQAGQQATLRSLDLIIQEDMRVKVVQLPSGFDPDSYIHKYGAERFRGMIENAKDLFDYKLNVLTLKFDRKHLEGKAAIVEGMLPTISKMNNAVLKSGYLKKLAEQLAVDEESLRIELKKVRPDYSYKYQPDKKSQTPSGPATGPAEKILAGLMIENNSLISVVKEKLTMDDFRDISIKKIITSLFRLHSQGAVISAGKLINCFEEDEIGERISEIVAANENLTDKERNMEDCIQWIRQHNLKEELSSLRGLIKTAQDSGNHDRVVELVTQYNDLIKDSSKS